jgi:hypothetical protein
MNRYRLFDFTLGSDVEFPELTRHAPGEPDWIFAITKLSPEAPPPSVIWLRHCSQPDGSPWLSVARTSSGYLLRFWDLADFIVDMQIAHIAGLPLPTTSRLTLRHLLLDHVVPVVCSVGNRLVLHAGGVVIPEGGVLFLGEGGRGKSTLTASFAQNGFRTLGDDAVMISSKGEELVATPSYPGVRLWPDMVAAIGGPAAHSLDVAEYVGKERLLLDPATFVSADPVPVAAIFVLGNVSSGKEESATRVPAQAAIVELIRHGHYLDGRDRRWLESHFSLAGCVATQVPFFRLVYPRQTARLAAVRDIVLSHAQKRGLGLN